MRKVLPHLILALGGLTLAYLVWTDDDEGGDPNEVTLVECPNLGRVHLSLGRKEATLEPASGDEPLWVTTVEHPAEDDEDGADQTMRFVGNDAAREFLTRLSPFRARRSLGELSEEQLEEIGLATPEGQLTLTCGGEATVFDVGERVFGTAQRYVRRQGGGPVFLVAADRIQPLESAEGGFLQRELHTFEVRDVEAVSVRAYDRTRRLEHVNRLDPATAAWVDAENPEQRDQEFANWMVEVGRLVATRYRDERPEGAEDVLRIDYEGEDGELGFLELVRDGTDIGFYAKTETTRTWVLVPAATYRRVIDNLPGVMGVDPPEEPEGEGAEGEAGDGEGAGETGEGEAGEGSGAPAAEGAAVEAGTETAPTGEAAGEPGPGGAAAPAGGGEAEGPAGTEAAPEAAPGGPAP